MKTVKNNKKLIIIDIQPCYHEAIHFTINSFVEYLKTFDEVLYFYNGEDFGLDSKGELIEWLMDYGMKEDDFHNGIRFIEKTYGNFRDMMESKDEEDIIKLLKYMIKKDINDSRDITNKKIKDKYNLTRYDIFMPSHFCYGDIERFENCYLIGGGRYECLMEFELFLKVHNFKYRYNHEFIYG